MKRKHTNKLLILQELLLYHYKLFLNSKYYDIDWMKVFPTEFHFHVQRNTPFILILIQLPNSQDEEN